MSRANDERTMASAPEELGAGKSGYGKPGENKRA